MKEIYAGDIKLSSTNGTGDSNKDTERLSRIIGYVFCACCDDVLNKIESLHDHEGVLQVGCKKSLSQSEKDIFINAWKSPIGDGADNVEFE